MKFSTTKAVCRLAAPRATAIAAASLCSLLAASANAAFVSHPELTPYQIINVDNQCVQAQSLSGGTLSFAACDAANNLQKFYLLDQTRDSDVMLQNQSAGGIRIAMAASLDSVPSPNGAYNVLNLSGGSTVNIANNLPNTSSAQHWVLTQVRPATTVRAFEANENELRYFTGLRTIQYGANGAYATKVVGAVLGVDNQLPCTNAFFGRDPAPGIAKACYFKVAAPIAYTKLTVTIENMGTVPNCVEFGSGTLVGQPCAAMPMPRQTFKFQPTTYPQ